MHLLLCTKYLVEHFFFFGNIVVIGCSLRFVNIRTCRKIDSFNDDTFVLVRITNKIYVRDPIKIQILISGAEDMRTKYFYYIFKPTPTVNTPNI